MKVSELIFPCDGVEFPILDTEFIWYFDKQFKSSIPLTTFHKISKTFCDGERMLFIGNRGNYAGPFYCAFLAKEKKIRFEIVILDSFLPHWDFHCQSLFDDTVEKIRNFHLQDILVPFRQPYIYGLSFFSHFTLQFPYIFLEDCENIHELNCTLNNVRHYLFKGSRLFGYNFNNEVVRGAVLLFAESIGSKVTLHEDPEIWEINRM